MSFHVGEDIGDYRVVSIVGAGSMGQVFLVEHRITKREEALKVLTAECATESQVLRFQREIEVQARLDHLHIARLHNAMCVKGSLMLVMEYVEGESLERKLQKGNLSREAGIDYICQTLAALDYAHKLGVVHRDVTPGNLIIDQDGNAKLTDFGVAKSLGDYQLTNAGEIVGSLHYMPPEQVRRHSHPDPRSDIYSAGAVLYEILTRRKLFNCSDRLTLMVAQVQKQPLAPIDIDPSIGPELNAVVLKALAKDPAQRYQSAKEFLDALQPFARESRAPAEPAPLPLQHHFAKASVVAAALAACALAFTSGSGRVAMHPSAALATHAAPAPSTILPPSPIPSVAAVAPQVHVAKKHSIRRPRRAEESISAREDTIGVTTEPVSDAPQITAPHKKRFWSRFNPFKRRTSNPDAR